MALSSGTSGSALFTPSASGEAGLCVSFCPGSCGPLEPQHRQGEGQRGGSRALVKPAMD